LLKYDLLDTVMNMSLGKTLAGCALVVGLVTSGCKDKPEAPLAPPPAPPAPISLTAPADPATPVADPNAPPPPPGTATPTAISAPDLTTVDKFKGLTPQQIEEYKASATPETHDLNMGPLLEAVNGYKMEFRRFPTTQEELVKARYLPRVLHAPKGKKYVINPESGEITIQ
jgi:hypothetical protein